MVHATSGPRHPSFRCRLAFTSQANEDVDLPGLLVTPDYAGRTPMHLACASGHDRIVEELLTEWSAAAPHSTVLGSLQPIGHRMIT